MVRRMEVRLIDDLDGTQIRPGRGETVRFSLEGRQYEIDLSARNAALLRKTLKPYVDAGRVMKGSRRSRRP